MTTTWCDPYYVSDYLETLKRVITATADDPSMSDLYTAAVNDFFAETVGVSLIDVAHRQVEGGEEFTVDAVVDLVVERLSEVLEPKDPEQARQSVLTYIQTVHSIR